MSAFKLRKEKDCLNCGHIVEENFCPHCGQENIVVKEDAFHMVSHAIADYFHFEHRFFGTIKPLLFQPGQLTKAYVEGKRVSFIHPIRLYIFISIVFFLVVLSEKRFKESNDYKKTQDTAQTAKQSDSLTLEEKEVISTFKYVPNKNLRDSLIKNAKEEFKANRVKEDKGKNNTNTNWNIKNNRKWGGNWASDYKSVMDYEKKQAALTKDKRDGFIKHYIVRRSIELNQYPDPGKKFLEDFLHNIPKMMFLLLPMFALILKLVYINKKKYYYEHLIYSFHVHSAIFLSILITMLLQWMFKFVYDISGWLSFICIIYMIWYIYRSLRTFYGSTRWVTVLKLFFLTFCYNMVLTLCFLLVIAMSFIMI
ncbi:DUF3667 domain-containing protein [Pedobacter insulae]|uniref:DUF3667 domain-containing protein n=1 Tax=Pedobacter insulae TaxID=414048 RepID=A0A1I3AHL5_9SPHI|nr:DUF3667 domain-containing protein [Pedobacter insulae]SFH49564.1 Protein of unknown function [Pedobacter insulae]